ncbi:hypothetical protein [Gloeobacter kilaueensis]|uniref:Uncharacterized protein n=1 Tax=Gloeobacter kilaueensis (strain ATCC BAA-2537 / CCAP 1431/1 / ULC 316 / JS1) TaxID=1183438 RepID=U5QLD5_GLOK1|nr:hypothetical protein [Gloeobacter kilaueensis]AGY58399.1 hypothetical protein GKIL_2153 [Gloeobacter kilaueensis JS1]
MSEQQQQRNCAEVCQNGCIEAANGTPEKCPHYESMLQARATVENTSFDRLMELAEEGAIESRLRGIGATPKFEDLPPEVRRMLTGEG